MEEEALLAPGSHTTPDGKHYRFVVVSVDWDLDHGDASLFTFVVTGSERSFEKVVAVPRQDIAGQEPSERMYEARRLAELRLFQKLDSGNEADEPTPLA